VRGEELGAELGITPKRKDRVRLPSEERWGTWSLPFIAGGSRVLGRQGWKIQQRGENEKSSGTRSAPTKFRVDCPRAGERDHTKPVPKLSGREAGETTAYRQLNYPDEK